MQIHVHLYICKTEALIEMFAAMQCKCQDPNWKIICIESEDGNSEIC